MEYDGFFIDLPCGNNIFSYEERTNKKIYVAPLIKVNFERDNIIKNIVCSDKIAFSEYNSEENIQYDIAGIKNFLFAENNSKKIYIFDNHNHAFYFIACEMIEEAKKINNMQENILSKYLESNIKLPKQKLMIHFDQHKDMRKPDITLLEAIKDINNGHRFFDKKKSCLTDKDYLGIYTNYTLNVGSFIVPLIDNKFIQDVFIVDSTYSMQELKEKIDSYDEIILDIDLDFFSSDMDYIDNEEKIQLIKKCYKKANIITICTSPYFIEFDRAKKYLGKILDVCIC